MTRLLLTGVDGNLGRLAAEYLVNLTDKDNLIFGGYSEQALEKYARQGIETRHMNFNHPDGLQAKFEGADVVALISMPFV